MGHMPQKVVAHAPKSCGTCPKKLWHMPQKVVARAAKSCDTSHEKKGTYMSQLFVACAPYFRGMYHSFSWHVPSDGHDNRFHTKAVTMIDNFKNALVDTDNQ